MAERKRKKRSKTYASKSIKDMDIDEFMSTGLADSEEIDDETDEEKLSEKTRKRRSTDTGSSHKDDLAQLEETDPEFFRFLKDNDQKLLEFSDESEGEESDGEGEEREGQRDEGKGKDAEGEEESDEHEEEFSGKSVTADMLKQWEKQLKKFSVPAFHQVTRALACAVSEMGGVQCDINDYTVQGETEFNRIVELCLTYGMSVLNHHVPEAKRNRKSLASTHHNWSKVRSPVRLLLTNLMTLTRQLTDKTVLVVLLKQIEQLTRFYVCFPRMLKSLVKVLVLLWCESSDHIRIVAFVSLRKLAILQSTKFLNSVMKRMYLSFVANSKFTSPKSRPLIVLMENCLVEMYNLDHHTTYQHGFVYIRQLAVHLRTAMVQQKKDTYQAVYNWQYVHCIELWCRVLADCVSETLKPLIYPLVQTTLGVIRLIPTPRYYPLRFHCVHFLNMLADKTNALIPIAPLILEVLDSPALMKKPRPSTSKPVSFSHILRVSKSQLQTKAFQGSTFDNVVCLLMEYFSLHSHSIAFPELILPATIRLRKFLKKCKVAQYSRQIKQLVDKLEETGSSVTAARASVSFSPRDTVEVTAWENERRQKGNSLVKYFSSWQQMQKLKTAHTTTTNESEEEEEEEGTGSFDEEESDSEAKPKKKKLEKNVEKQTVDRRKRPADIRKKRTGQKHTKLPSKDSLDNKHADVVEEFSLWSDED